MENENVQDVEVDPLEGEVLYLVVEDGNAYVICSQRWGLRDPIDPLLPPLTPPPPMTFVS